MWFVFALAIVAGTLSGVVGTGSSILLLPVLVGTFGPKEAVPIMALAAFLGNLARMGAWWRHVDWRATLAYALPGAPAAALGAHTLLGLQAWCIDLLLGLFFLAMVPARRRLRRARWSLSLAQLALCGAGIGFLTGLVLSTGPVSVPVFLAYGLGGGAFLGTEAASALLLYAGKIGTFAAQDALPARIVVDGLLVGAGIMAGTACGKALVTRLPPARIDLALDALLILSAAQLLRSAFSVAMLP